MVQGPVAELVGASAGSFPQAQTWGIAQTTEFLVSFVISQLIEAKTKKYGAAFAGHVLIRKWVLLMWMLF